MASGAWEILTLKIIKMKKIQNYFKLLRSPSYIVGALILIKFALFQSMDADTTLSIQSFFLLLLSLVFIEYSGYLIYDIHAIKSDRVNFPDKPLVLGTVSVKNALTLYIVITFIGVALGMYVSYSIDHTSYGMLFVAIAAIPYLYATGLKNTGAIGNIMLASLAFIGFTILGILDLMPSINEANQMSQAAVFRILLLYGGFGFALAYIESIISNLRSLPGDRKIGVKTLANQLGFSTTKKVAAISSVIVFIVLVFCVYTYIENNKLLTYFVFAVMAPFIYFIIQLIYLKKEEMHRQIKILQSILKILYITGILSILLLNYF